MKRKMLIITTVLMLMGVISFGGIAQAATVETTIYYGDTTFPAEGSFAWQPGTWDLNACPVDISYTLDLSGAPNVAYTGNYGHMGNVGLLWPGTGWAGAKMGGFLSDWDNPGSEFPTFPDNPNTFDMDDKFNLNRWPNPEPWDETMYDVLCTTPPVVSAPFGTYLNYGIWFDRDGVDPYQAGYWGSVDGGNYNTDGIYDVQISFSKYSSTKGIACPLMSAYVPSSYSPTGYGIPTGFWTADWKNAQPEKYPAGLSFDTDGTKMADMHVAVWGASGNGTIAIRNLTVTGCLYLEEGSATGGGWFIAEDTGGMGNVTPGGKATFGFVAKQKTGTSSGQLEFQYKTDDLNLKSTSYDWVTVATTQAMFEGIGRLNGVDGYKFRVRAVDGDKIGTSIDRFEIRIWTGGGGFDSPTHRAEGDLGGGQIVVHKK